MNRRFLPPPPPRVHPLWGVASVAFHLVVIALLVVYSGWSYPTSAVTLIALPPPEASAAPGAPIQWPSAGTAARGPAGARTPSRVARAGSGTDTTHAGAVAGQAPTAGRPAPPTKVAKAAGAAGAAGGQAKAGAETGEGTQYVEAGHRRLGPQYGDGRIWQSPIAGLAHGEVNDTAAFIASVDSAVAAKVQAFLDTLPPDSFAVQPPPSWKRTINGKTWGLDGKWIYLGGIKVPTVLLALLPLPQGNYDQAQQAAALMRIREDIMQAANRAENAAEFNKAVRELRARNESEHRKGHLRYKPLPPPDSTRS